MHWSFSPQPAMNEALLAGIAWGAWCGLHSLLAWPRLQQRLEAWVPALVGRYRLTYNLAALVSLLPLGWWEWQRSPGPLVLAWSGPWQLLQALAWVAAAALAYGGARVYPLREFVGLADPDRGAKGTPTLVTDGVLGLVRHPWYLAVLLGLWARDLDRTGIVTALVLSLYLVVGSRLEEGRLECYFGAAYRDYRRRVSGLLPLKYLLRRLRR